MIFPLYFSIRPCPVLKVVQSRSALLNDRFDIGMKSAYTSTLGPDVIESVCVFFFFSRYFVLGKDAGCCCCYSCMLQLLLFPTVFLTLAPLPLSLYLCLFTLSLWQSSLSLFPSPPIRAPQPCTGAPAPPHFRNGSHAGMSKSSTTRKTSRGMPPPSGPPPIPRRKFSIVRNFPLSSSSSMSV